MDRQHIAVLSDSVDPPFYLEWLTAEEGFEVLVSAGGIGRSSLAVAPECLVVMVETDMPELRGLELCARIREQSDRHIILLTDDYRPDTAITALESGVDDVIVKPVHPRLLAARIRALLRRVSGSPRPSILRAGELLLDLRDHTAICRGMPLALTRTEFSILRMLLTHANSVVTFEHILTDVWDDLQLDLRTVRVHIANIRRKLRECGASSPVLINVERVGYLLNVPPAKN